MNGGNCARAFSFILLVLLFLGCVNFKTYAASHSIERQVLDNGMVVLTDEQHQLPFITINLLFDAGSWRDPEKEAGLANLTAEALMLGTENFSLDEISRELDFLGAELSTSCDRDFMLISFRILTRHLDRGMELLNEVIMRPAFPKGQVQRKIREIQASIQSSQDQPDYIADRKFHVALFRQNPYGHPVEGTVESLSRTDRNSVSDFHRKFLRPNNAILAVVGDVSGKEMEEVILPRMKDWKAESIEETEYKRVFEENPASVRTDRPVTQANIVMGHSGIERSNEDYYAVSVMNQILGGGGFSSRLLQEIRVKHGLAYSVSSSFSSRKFPGSFQIVMQTSNSTAGKAMKIAMEEIRKMQEEPPSEQELETAVQYLVGSFPMRFDSQEELANYLVQIEYYELGLEYFEKYPEYIQAVSGKDVLNAARNYLKPEKVISSVVADMEETDLDKINPER